MMSPPPFCPERGFYFETLLRERYPGIWYRMALLQVMVSLAGILAIDSKRDAA
jgi:hypothetical protein